MAKMVEDWDPISFNTTQYRDTGKLEKASKINVSRRVYCTRDTGA